MKYKEGICVQCADDKPKPLIAKQCSYHYRVSMYKRSLEREKERAMRDGLDLIFEKKAMDQWFADGMRSPRICENCGADLSRLNEHQWRGSQHHILEKSIFDSVKVHPMNRLVLGYFCCHPIVTNDPEKITEMRCFEKAKAKAQEVKPSIIFSEIKRFPHYFED